MDDSAPPQASTVQLTPYSLPLRLSSRLLQSHRIHTSALCERFSKKRFAVFERFISRKLSRQMQDFKNETRGALLRQKATLPQPAEFYNKSGAARCAKSNGCPSPGNPWHFPLENNFHFVAEVPLSSTFEILHLSAGAADRMKAENRSPISSTFRGGRGCGDGDSERFVGKT